MALQETRNNQVSTNYVGMNKDIEPSMIKDGIYTHAINSQLNNQDGNMPFISNEQSTLFCSIIPYTLIGSIALQNKRFVLFSTDNSNSEIGIFDEKSCTYTKVINASCLKFNTSNLIRGVAKQNRDGSESVYWCDNLNNDRVLDLGNIPYTFTYADDTCQTKIFSNNLDCEVLAVNQQVKIPKLTLHSENRGGSLSNGAYQAVMTYSVKGQSVTDFYGVTQVKSIFSHEDLGGKLTVDIENLDENFNEFTLHIIVTRRQQTTVYELGNYSTTKTKVTITNINETNTVVPLDSLYFQKIAYDKSENVIASNDHLIWISPTTKPDLNYQQLANQITAKWVAYAVPIEDKNFDIQSYMRDEIYALAIGWKYLDGTRTFKYPLIGRAATEKENEPVMTDDVYELFLKNCDKNTEMKRWQVYNTATGTVSTSEKDKCDYAVIGTGDFGYYESTEVYPDNQELYGELACTPIRLFRFPDDSIVPRVLRDRDGKETHIIHLGIQLFDIPHPVDLSGNRLSNIQGYEVFRASRETQKTILGKGLLFNMGEYDLPDKSGTALYPNYPYNDVRTDGFLSKKQTKGNIKKEENYVKLGTFSKQYHTFHSPSFSFNKPSFGSELKIEGTESGSVEAMFDAVYNHPKAKLITDAGFIAAVLIGLAEAFFATREQVTETFVTEAFNLGIGAGTGTTGTVTPPSLLVAAMTSYQTAKAALDNVPMVAGDIAQNTARAAYNTAVQTLINTPFLPGRISHSEQKVPNPLSGLPKAIRLLNDVYLFAFYFQKGTETGLNLIRSFSKYEQYATQVNSVCNYNSFRTPQNGEKRRYIDDISYLYPTMQSFDGRVVNNFKRESTVILKLNRDLAFPKVKDTSRQTMAEANACDSNRYTANASSHYASVKQKNDALYGQIENIQWIDTGYYNHITSTKSDYTTDVILGGDTFINRFSVKRKFQYFNQTAFGENDGFEFDYRKYINVAYPRYWIDSDPYDLSELVSFEPQLPNDKLNLDCGKTKKKIKDKFKSPFVVRDRKFYISNNGVINFFVESEINLANRDWEDQDFHRHYDKDQFSDLKTIFRSDYLTYDNRYIYDQSYSKQLVENAGQTQNIYYDPLKENTIFTKLRNRVFWSLQNNKDLVIDNWKNYLPNNYYDFPMSNGNLTGAKALDKTNIVFFFDNAGPHIHRAIDELKTEDGIKIAVGDGGLFARDPEAIMNTDLGYGNSSTRFGYSNTQYGVFYPSEKQGRVFLLQGNNLKEISRDGLHFWFQKYLPFRLTQQYPDYVNVDNTVTGIGFNTVFDNTLETYYLIKKDFMVKPELLNIIKYDSSIDQFYFLRQNKSRQKIKFGDPNYFLDCSWTVSYSAKLQVWVSFHDWHPNSVIQTENHFLAITNPTTSRQCTIWKHNMNCQSHCKYYDEQFSWDIEFVAQSNGISTLSNVEYYLESYKYDSNCVTKHHVLDDNFTKAFIYTSEQHSGILNLNLGNKNKITQVLDYPKINIDSIDIVYHKEEQRIRFNQFWDITKNRAEFNSDYVSDIEIFENGYRYNPNPSYLNYGKPLFERKKLRNSWFKVYLSKQVTTNEMNNFRFKLAISKLLNSPR